MAKRNFPNSRQNSQVTLEPNMAIAIIGISSAFADEEAKMEHEEDYALGELLCSISGFEEYSEEDYVELYNSAIEILNSEGWDEALMQAVESLPNKDTREAAYITAVTVLGIDGDIPEQEQEFLAALQENLKISDARAEKLVEECFEDEEDEDEDEEDDEE